MQPEQRRKALETYLLQVEFASLEELASVAEASVSTVRRDLSAMELETGRIRRTHGGARLARPISDEFAFSSREQVEAKAKDRIGRACAALIPYNQNLFLDAGSTVYAVARRLEEKTPHIVTNSLSIANLYASHPDIEVVVSGGVIYPRVQTMVGPLAVHTFTQLRADTAIMGAGGLVEEGIMNSHLLMIEIQQAMIASAQRVIFCLDHTKVGRRSFAHLCGWQDVDIVVTNREAPSDILDLLRQTGVDVVLA